MNKKQRGDDHKLYCPTCKAGRNCMEHLMIRENDLQEQVTQLKADLATAKQGLVDLPRLVPTNWLDPLLSGDDAVVKTCDNREIEALLLGIQTRQRDAAKLVLDAIGKE